MSCFYVWLQYYHLAKLTLQKSPPTHTCINHLRQNLPKNCKWCFQVSGFPPMSHVSLQRFFYCSRSAATPFSPQQRPFTNNCPWCVYGALWRGNASLWLHRLPTIPPSLDGVAWTFCIFIVFFLFLFIFHFAIFARMRDKKIKKTNKKKSEKKKKKKYKFSRTWVVRGR